ncbi:MAG TPA: aldehyde dehydrogenase family protein, partial [Candidatus Marinimicrobia bacterium]|nr:aldehyde dehydrogenase family protein [Candidatus Neomarinimicrobiota bacterium]
MLDLLKKCGISDSNLGSCVGGSDWFTTKDAGINTSINPSNEEVIATVFEANKGDYEKVVKKAQSA